MQQRRAHDARFAGADLSGWAAAITVREGPEEDRPLAGVALHGHRLVMRKASAPHRCPESLMTASLIPEPTENAAQARNVLLLFANFGGNLGDILIAECTVEWLCRSYPGCSIHIHIQDGRREEALVQSFAARHPNVTFLPPMAVSPGPADGANLYQDLLDALRGHDIAQVFSAMDAVICLGGGHWSGVERPLFMAAMITVAAERCAHVSFMPHSMASVIRDEVKPILGPCLNRLAVAAMRDPLSLRLAQALGVRTAVLVPDSAFLTARSVPVRERPNATPRILVSLRHNSAGATDPSWWEKVPAIGQQITHQGATLELLSTYPRQDQTLTTALQGTLGCFVHDLPDLDGIFAALSQVDVIISDRLHVLIMGTILGIPILPVLTLGKVAGYVDYLGWDVFVPSFAQLDWNRHIAPLLQSWPERQDLLRRYAGAARVTLETALARTFPPALS